MISSKAKRLIEQHISAKPLWLDQSGKFYDGEDHVQIARDLLGFGLLGFLDNDKIYREMYQRGFVRVLVEFEDVRTRIFYNSPIKILTRSQRDALDDLASRYNAKIVND